MKGRFGMLHATAFVVAIMARLIRTQDVPVSTVKPHRGYDHCNPGCVGVVITPAYYPQVCRPYDHNGLCRCAPEGRVYDIHKGNGVLNMTSPILQGSKEPFRRRATEFESFHARQSCDTVAQARTAACAETENPRRCNEEWPLNDMRYALYPRKWYKERRAIAAAALAPGDRPHKFCYIGRSSHHRHMERRGWIEDWARQHFDNTSIFVYTDVNRTSKQVGAERLPGKVNSAAVKYTPLGPFDHTFDWEGEGFVPTDHAVKTMSRDQGIAMANHLDKSYYELMSKCKYALTPAGDATWSMRFYEALVLGVVPVVRSMKEDAHRSPEELTAGYKVALAGGGNDEFPLNTTEAASHNLKLFESFHMLPIPCVVHLRKMTTWS